MNSFPAFPLHGLVACVLGLTLLASCSPSPRAALAPAPGAAECQARQMAALVKSGFRPGMDLDSLREASLDSAIARSRDRRRPDADTARLDRAPRLLNTESMEKWMSMYYPPTLASAGLGGATTLIFLASPDSTPTMVRVFRSSGYAELDLASVRVIRMARMAPGIYHGCPVWATVTMPITWAPRRPAAGGTPR